jgi:hypothetical protein
LFVCGAVAIDTKVLEKDFKNGEGLGLGEEAGDLGFLGEGDHVPKDFDGYEDDVVVIRCPENRL